MGKARHRIDQPVFKLVLRSFDHPRAGTPLRHRFGQPQGNECAAKTHQRGKSEQRSQLQAVGCEEAIHAQHAGCNAQDQHHSQIGGNEQDDAFHGFPLSIDDCRYDGLEGGEDSERQFQARLNPRSVKGMKTPLSPLGEGLGCPPQQRRGDRLLLIPDKD